LSHNKIKKITGLKKLVNLEKLSISHNELRELSGLETNENLTQLRVNDNKIMRVPESIKSNSRLEILDLGNNRIGGQEYIKDLNALQKLTQISLRGNPIKELENEELLQKHLLELCPKLLIINNKRVVPKKVHTQPKPSELKKPKISESEPRKIIKLHKIEPRKSLDEAEKLEEKKEDILEISEEELKKIKTGKRTDSGDIKKQKSSGIVNIEQKKKPVNPAKSKKVKDLLSEVQQSKIEKWN